MRAIFVDRDGVINRNRKDYVKSWEEFEFLPHSAEALAELTRHGLMTVIVTNQSVINRGIVSRERVEEINARMVASLEALGAKVQSVLYCPHRREEGCSCRKPQPGMLFQAAKKFGIDLPRSYVVGDALTDLAAGEGAGCRTILVMTGRGVSQFLSIEARRRQGYMVARDLREAVQRILAMEDLVKLGWLEARLLRALSPFRLATDAGFPSAGERQATDGLPEDLYRKESA